MERVAAKAEAVFAKALELTVGAARARFVAEQCAGDQALRGEVESLLQAHEEAGGFLKTATEQNDSTEQQLATLARQGTLAMNAATQAEVFLRNPNADAGAALESYIANASRPDCASAKSAPAHSPPDRRKRRPRRICQVSASSASWDPVAWA
jgi:hypothetical protein